MSALFCTWVHDWNIKLAGCVHLSDLSMIVVHLESCSVSAPTASLDLQGQSKIVPITDNAPTHTMIEGAVPVEEHGLLVLSMSHIEVVFLTPYVTSHVQPVDPGIIASLKSHRQ